MSKDGRLLRLILTFGPERLLPFPLEGGCGSPCRQMHHCFQRGEAWV